MSRLNGWQRLWVAGAGLTLLWAVWWALQAAADSRMRYDFKVAQGFDRKECLHIVRMPAGSKLDKEPPYNDPCWEIYSYRSIFRDAASTKDGYGEHLAAEHRRHIYGHGLVALIMWAVGVALVYGMGLIVSWVVRGFRQPK